MAALCVLLLCACVYDYRARRIPNWLIVLLFLGAVAMKMTEASDGVEGDLIGSEGGVNPVLLAGLLGMCMQMLGVLALFYGFFKIGALGAGDVKLLSVCAGFLPAPKILVFLFLSLFIAALFSLYRFLREQNIRERMQYLWEYLRDVMRSGAWQLYMENEDERRKNGICLSGPILCSVLLYLGGAY